MNIYSIEGKKSHNANHYYSASVGIQWEVTNCALPYNIHTGPWSICRLLLNYYIIITIMGTYVYDNYYHYLLLLLWKRPWTTFEIPLNIVIIAAKEPRWPSLRAPLFTNNNNKILKLYCTEIATCRLLKIETDRSRRFRKGANVCD